ncbi:MAG: HIT domain-containing protein [Spirochaetaceae bacterium]|nr:HIT domain-containing protein [Spirochaetaceae bacterium]
MEYFFNFNKIAYLRGKRPDGCILCLIRDGSPDVDRLIVHETARFLVTLNLYPYNPGHLLVFPKRHVLDLRELDRDESLEQDRIVRLCLDVLDRYGKPSAYNIGYNMGLNAGASIEHLHLHIIPRYPREIGIAELIGGARVLVQDPKDTQQALRALFDEVQRNSHTDE